MCGIAGIHVKRKQVVKSQEGLEKFVDTMLLGIEHRGKHATGFVARAFDGKVVIDKGAVTASDFIKSRDPLPENLQTVLLHTRYWTKGDPENHANNHPVMSGTCFAVHNGHIKNDDELFKDMNLSRIAQVDSEAIPAVVSAMGFENHEEYLEKFEGAMATAIINPVDFPGRLVLAKGMGSPLVYVETDKFVLWASTEEAIREAWAKVIGTPPAKEKFISMKYGSFMVFDGEKKIEGTFKPKVAAYTPQTTWQRPTPRPAFGRPVTEADEKDTKALEVRLMVQTARRLNEDWVVCPTYSSSSTERDELFERFNLDKLTWIICPCCNASVLKECFVKTMSWGNICFDCKEGHMRVYKENASRIQAEEEAEEGAFNFVIDKETEELLTKHVAHDGHLHRMALKEVESISGIDRDIIEWLIFRASTTYLDRHPTMGDIRNELDVMYTDVMDGMWENEGNDPTEMDDSDDAVGWCHEHSDWYKPADDCPKCLADIDRIDERHKVIDAEIEAAYEADSCGTEIVKAESFTPRVCECGQYMYGTNVKECHQCTRTKADKTRKGKKALLDIKVCNEQTCTNEPNHTDIAQGERWCHEHSRNRPNLVHDKVLARW
jgi:hypothetical protein